MASGPLSAYVGGYQSKDATKLALAVASICGVIALPMPFIDNIMFITVDLWMYLFFGGIAVPLMTGIFLANVDIEHRT